MKTVTITLSLEDDKFNEMEKILLDNGSKNFKKSVSENDWIRYVIETYEDTKSYLDYHKGNLEEAYKDMLSDV